MPRKFAAVLTCTLFLAVAVTACTKKSSTISGTTASQGDTVRIVVEGPMTGEQSATGIDMWNAATLAADKANAAGGIDGKQIELIRGDDKADPATGVALANKYAGNVFAVIGPYNSSVGIENLPIWIKGGTIPIHLTSNAATDGMGYTVQPKDYQVAPVEAKAVAGYMGAKKVAIVYDKSTYTAGIAKQVRDALVAAGVDIPLYLGFNADSFDAGAVAAKVKKVQPDVVYASTYYPQGGKLTKALASDQSGCFNGLANQDAAFVKVSGLAAAQNCLFSGVPSASQFPRAGHYVADYKAKFGKVPGTWGAFTYDSLQLLIVAVLSSQSWSPQTVQRNLSEMKDYTGITGNITIDPKTGNRTNVPVVVLVVNKQGQFVIDPKWAKFAGFAL